MPRGCRLGSGLRRGRGRWLGALAGVAAALPAGASLAQWKASLFAHEPDSSASHGRNWRRWGHSALNRNSQSVLWWGQCFLFICQGMFTG